jgi:hypothetical protein
MDSRSELKKLEDTSFDIRNVNGQEVLTLEHKLVVSPPKADQEHRQVVRKIHTLRDMLDKLSAMRICATHGGLRRTGIMLLQPGR